MRVRGRCGRFPSRGVIAALFVASLVLVGFASSATAAAPTAWTGSGSGTTTVVRDGTSGGAQFSYANNGLGIYSGSWSFSTTSNLAGAVTLPWRYSGFHSWFRVTVSLNAFVTHAGTTTTTLLVSDGPASCCVGPPSGGFSYAGKTTLSVNVGDTYGFTMSGSHQDGTYALQGTLTIGPTISTTATDTVELGRTIAGSATLKDAAPGAQGTITFKAYSNSECLNPVHTKVVAVTGDGTYADPGFVPVQTGTYYWTAIYSGDPATNTLGATAGCGPVTSTVTAPSNDSWPRALPIELDGAGNGTATGGLNLSGQARWYKIPVTPGGDVQVDLTNLPANYDLALFSDIGQAFKRLTSPSDLQRVAAEFGTDAFSPSVFSPSVFSPSVFSPSVFSPSVFSPSVFSPSVFSPSVFSPSVFSPSVFSPSVFSPSVFSPSVFSPSVFSPSVFSPDPTIYEGAQVRSLVGISARDGSASESTFANVWNNTGSFYIRVNGRNGTYAPGAAPFTLKVHVNTGTCGGVVPSSEPLLAAGFAVPGPSLKTVILASYGRMTAGPDLTAMQSKVSALAAKVDGTVVDLGQVSPRIAALNTQADARAGCSYAKNLVAGAIRDVVGAYRDQNPNLKYIVIVGNDHVIPFFRYPDTAGLGPESSYAPPVLDSSASQASLQSNTFLSQDAYGSKSVLHVKGVDVPLPDLPVGRLVETPAEISGLLDAYASLANGVVPTPRSSLVAGYDFMAGGAQSVLSDFSAGLGSGATNDQLITDQGVAPSDTGAPPRHSWTAAQLRTQLLGQRHDLMFLAAHFSANNALAADYATTLNSTELAASTVDLTNAIVLSAGCHSGYNIDDGDAVPNVTQPLDWTEAFAKKRATLIAGTGYQYGDTDFLEYSERLYAYFAHTLRLGTGPVAVGNALVQAKQTYLTNTTNLRGIDVKSLLVSTLYGLPMLSVDLPSGRIAPPQSSSIVTATTAFTTNPGAELGLSYFDHVFSPALTTHTRQLVDRNGSAAGMPTATYLSGKDGVVTGPGAPALPLAMSDVTAGGGKVLRGVGFRGATYADATGITPLTGAPATELGGVHSPFISSAFFPSRPWTVNYFGGLTGSPGATQLMLTPAQYASDAPGSLTDVQRTFSNLDLRLYYSANTTTYGANTPALAAPPTISRVDATAAAGTVTFKLRVVGDPSAGLQQAWVTYTGVHPSTWESLDLAQDATDSTLWTGTLAGLTTAQVNALRFVVQAVNGVGLVSLDDNQGSYYRSDEIPPALQTAAATRTTTTLGLSSPPAAGDYGSTAQVSATLTGGGALAGKPVSFTIGASTTTAVTDGGGVATAQLPLVSLPGGYQLAASFDGDATFTGASDSVPFTIRKLATALTLSADATVMDGAETGMTATLKSGDVGLPQRSVAFVLTPTDASAPVIQTRITDLLGRASLGLVPQLRPGTYGVRAYFGSGAPIALPVDSVYESGASATSQLAVLLPQAVTFTSTPPANAVYGGSYTVTATGGGSGQPVVFSIDPSSGTGVCSVSGATVSFDGVGQCVIDANQAGKGNYAAAPQVQQRLTVDRARLTVTADDQSRRFGVANAPLTATITGFVKGETLNTSGVSGSAACTTTATAASPGGKYPVECAKGTLSAAHYSFKFADGTLTVTYTRTISGTHLGKLVVAAGQSVLVAPGARVVGPVLVERGGALVIQDAEFAGLLRSAGAVAVRVCKSKILGATWVTDTSGPVVFGDDGPQPCAGNTFTGAVRLTGNGGVEFNGNTVWGPVWIMGNTGPVHAARNTIKGPATIQP